MLLDETEKNFKIQTQCSELMTKHFDSEKKCIYIQIASIQRSESVFVKEGKRP